MDLLKEWRIGRALWTEATLIPGKVVDTVRRGEHNILKATGNVVKGTIQKFVVEDPGIAEFFARPLFGLADMCWSAKKFTPKTGVSQAQAVSEGYMDLFTRQTGRLSKYDLYQVTLRPLSLTEVVKMRENERYEQLHRNIERAGERSYIQAKVKAGATPVYYAYQVYRTTVSPVHYESEKWAQRLETLEKLVATEYSGDCLGRLDLIHDGIVDMKQVEANYEMPHDASRTCVMNALKATSAFINRDGMMATPATMRPVLIDCWWPLAAMYSATAPYQRVFAGNGEPMKH
jgi:hypothetical protein